MPDDQHLARLRQAVEQLERQLPARSRRPRSAAQTADGARVSTTCGALDRLLARPGLERGSLVEWFSAGQGGGAATLAWIVAREAAREGGGVVVVDRQQRFYPPAAVAWGLASQALAVVRVERDEDELWVVDQALRSPGVAAVWLWRDELRPRDFRRWQLAAEAGGTIGLLLRPARARGRPTWADVQWSVRPVARGGPAEPSSREGSGARRVWRLEVELVRCRGGQVGQRVEVELDEVTGLVQEASNQHDARPVPAIARLAHSAPAG